MFLLSTFLVFVILIFLIMYLRMRCLHARWYTDVSFFHPYCNAGGGGERVLWQCVLALLEKRPQLQIYIYTGDTDATKAQILENAERCFGLKLPERNVHFVYLSTRVLVEAKCYPVCTLLGQSLGSMVVGFEALWRHPTGYFVDTMGYAFTYLLASWCGCDVLSYVHYPTISTDMLGKVESREHSYNNSSVVARNPALSALKLAYYKVFAWAYGKMGQYANIVFVNSSWTFGHINQIWDIPHRTYKLYPPCNTTDYLKIDSARSLKIISVAQFRPEKDHKLQIEAFKCFVKKTGRSDVTLTMVGGARHAADRQRVTELQDLVTSLDLAHLVNFKVGISYSELYRELSDSLIGIHTMWNEHFGIGVVEFMAAGIIPIAHDSGGPKMDIVVPGSGYLAHTAEQYCDCIIKVLGHSPAELEAMREIGRDHVTNMFSDESFRKQFLEQIGDVLYLDDED